MNVWGLTGADRSTASHPPLTALPLAVSQPSAAGAAQLQGRHSCRICTAAGSAQLQGQQHLASGVPRALTGRSTVPVWTARAPSKAAASSEIRLEPRGESQQVQCGPHGRAGDRRAPRRPWQSRFAWLLCLAHTHGPSCNCSGMYGFTLREMNPSHTWRYVYSRLQNPQRACWQPQACF